MAKQVEMFKGDTLDPHVAKVADKFIEHTQVLKSTKAKLKIQEKNLMGMLKGLKKTKVRHAGYIITVKHRDESEILKLREDKAAAKKAEKKKE